VAATIGPLDYDAALSLTSAPSNAVVGRPAALTATVKNNGPGGAPITFTDPVPVGLTVNYAATTDGSCATNTSLNIVTCTTAALPAGQSAEVGIIVTPKVVRTYTDEGEVAVEPGATDPDSANNPASTTLKVAAAGAPTKCVVPKLGGASLSLAKNVLPCSAARSARSRRRRASP
jgi:uncharacterized repeat protein (TIGR01451 family)